jgi:hypothetical protein
VEFCFGCWRANTGDHFVVVVLRPLIQAIGIQPQNRASLMAGLFLQRAIAVIRMRRAFS